MKILQNQGTYEILTPIEYLKQMLLIIEKAGRVCYKSEKGPITEETAVKFIKMLLAKGHYAVLEHSQLSVLFKKVSTGFTHEGVRHRIAAFCQESTRYVDYAKGEDQPNLDKFQCEFVLPPDKDINESIALANGQKLTPTEMFALVEMFYRGLRKSGWIAEDARQILPKALTSNLVITANLREWRHILYMRTAQPAHWEIRKVMVDLLLELQKILPGMFDDFVEDGIGTKGIPYYKCQYKDNL